MFIRFQPQDPKWAADRRVVTNLGEFLPGDERQLMPDQEPEGRRLVANGDFTEPSDETPSAPPVANPEEAISQKSKK